MACVRYGEDFYVFRRLRGIVGGERGSVCVSSLNVASGEVLSCACRSVWFKFFFFAFCGDRVRILRKYVLTLST